MKSSASSSGLCPETWALLRKYIGTRLLAGESTLSSGDYHRQIFGDRSPRRPSSVIRRKLHETVFCRQPLGFETSDPSTKEPHVMPIRALSIVFDKARTCGTARLTQELRKIGFSSTASGPRVHASGCRGRCIMSTLLVDDTLMTGPSIKLPQRVQDALKIRFSMSELGPVSLILGMEVIRDEAQGTLELSQQKYTDHLRSSA